MPENLQGGTSTDSSSRLREKAKTYSASPSLLESLVRSMIRPSVGVLQTQDGFPSTGGHIVSLWERTARTTSATETSHHNNRIFAWRACSHECSHAPPSISAKPHPQVNLTTPPGCCCMSTVDEEEGGGFGRFSLYSTDTGEQVIT